MNREPPDAQAGFRKGRGTRDQKANILWIMEKAREFQKNSGNSVRLYFFWAPKPLQMVIAAMKLKNAYSLEEKL